MSEQGKEAAFKIITGDDFPNRIDRFRASIAASRIYALSGAKLALEDIGNIFTGDFSSERREQRLDESVKMAQYDFKQWVVDHEVGTSEIREQFMAQLALRQPTNI